MELRAAGGDRLQPEDGCCQVFYNVAHIKHERNIVFFCSAKNSSGAGGDGLQPEGGRCLRRQTCKM